MSKRKQKSMCFQLKLETLKEESPTDGFEFLIPDILPPLKNGKNVIPNGNQIPRTPWKTEITVTKPSLEPSIDSESCQTKTDESLLKNMIPKGREIPRTPPNVSNLPFLLNESQPRTSSYLKPIDVGVKPLEDMDDIVIKLDYITIRKRPKPKSYNLDFVKSDTIEVVNLGDDSKDLHVDDKQKKSTRKYVPSKIINKPQESEIIEQEKLNLPGEKQRKCTRLRNTTKGHNTTQDTEILQQKNPQLEEKKQEISTRLHIHTESNIKLQDSEILEQKKPQLADEWQKKCTKLQIPTKIDNKPQDSEILEQIKSDNTPQNPDTLGHKMEQGVKKVEIAKNNVQVYINHQHKSTSEAKSLAGVFDLAADHSIENILKDNLKCQGLRIGESTMKNDTKSNDEMAEQKRRASRIPRRSSMISNQEGERSNTVKMQEQQRCINKQNVEVGKNNAKDNVKKQGVGDALLRDVTKQYEDEAVEKKNERARRIPKVSSLASKEDEKRCDVDVKLEGDVNKENIYVTKREGGNSALSTVKGGSKCNAREKFSLPSALQTRQNPSRKAKLSVNYCL